MLSRFSIIVAALALAGHGADAFAATGSLAGLRRATAASATLHKSRGMRMTMVPTAVDKETLKRQILQIAALTDRGQRLNTLVAPVYQEKRGQMSELADQLTKMPHEVTKASVKGEWELAYSDVELFRSSPFFLAIERALDTSPGIPTLGKWLGITDPTKKSAQFFKLHQLQVLSWGASTVGRISQDIDFEKGEFESAFDTIIFGLTTIPLLGWFKLLPTFGGRVVTVADKLTLQGNEMVMELAKTKVVECPGVARLPLLDGVFMDRWYPVREVWKLLPWNGGPFNGREPECRVTIAYVDEDFRLTRDMAGALYVYTRPVK